jgi:LuxR family maltose regulon positive regulatory protein
MHNVDAPFAQSQLLRTRLLVPQAGAADLERSLLLDRVAAVRRLRVFQITAPAGYGKTRLAAAAVRRLTDLQPAWLTLDSSDDRPDGLLAAITAALSPYLPDSGLGVAQQLRPGALHEAADLLLTGIAVQPQSLVLVLDDLHLIREQPALELLGRLIAGSPLQLHWLLLSRHDVPIGLTRRLLDADDMRLTRDDLRLSVDETAAYLALQQVQPPDPQQVQQLQERSDGWFAGLQCALLAWRRTDRTGRVDDLLGQLRGGQRLMSNYLVEELLLQLPARLAEFLLLCALPERLNPSLCDALTGGDDSAALLLEAERRQLFLQPLDAHGEWFVLHALWREFLLLEASRRLPEDQRRGAAQRAAAWLSRRGEAAAAVQVLVDSRQTAAAAALLVEGCPALLATHRLLELDRALGLLPAELIERSARLLTARAWSEFLSERRADLAVTLRLLADQADEVNADEVLVLQQLQLLMSGDRRGIFRELWPLRERLSNLSGPAAGWGLLLTAICFQADIAAGADIQVQFQSARRAFARNGNDFGEISVRVLAVMPLREAGRLPELISECRDGLAYVQRHMTIVGAPEALIQLSMIGAEALFFSDRPREAAELLQLGYREAQRTRNRVAVRKAALWLEICRAVGVAVDGPDPLPESVDWLESDELATELISNRVALLYLTALRRVMSSQGGSECRRALRALDIETAAVPLNRPTSAVLAVTTVRIAERDLDMQLLADLMVAAEQAEAQALRHLQIQLLVLAAVVARRLGRQSSARMLMRRVLVLLEHLPYTRLVLLFPELESTIRSIDHPHSENVARQFALQPSAPRRLTEQEVRILRLLADGASQSDIAVALALSVSTVKWYLHRLYRVIGVKNRREAAEWAQAQL